MQQSVSDRTLVLFAVLVCMPLVGCNTYRTGPYPASWEIEVVSLGQPEAAYQAADGTIAVRYHIDRAEPTLSGYHWLLIEPAAAEQTLLPKADACVPRHEVYRRSFVRVRTEESEPRFNQPVNAQMVPPILEPGLSDGARPAELIEPVKPLVMVFNEEGRVSLRPGDAAGVETRLIDLWPTAREFQTAAGERHEQRYRKMIGPVNAVANVVTAPVDFVVFLWWASHFDRSGK